MMATIKEEERAVKTEGGNDKRQGSVYEELRALFCYYCCIIIAESFLFFSCGNMF